MRTIPGQLEVFPRTYSPAPAVQASLYVPRINKVGRVKFLIDTGADSTCLNGPVAVGLQSFLDPQTLRPAYGIGGVANYFYERVTIVFWDDQGHPCGQQTVVGIQQIGPRQQSNPEIARLPCLLGRDIINRASLDYDAGQGRVRLVFP